MTRPKHPASSFGPNLFNALREGAVREVRLPCDTEQMATRLMHRLNSLRVALKREDHPDWKELYRCGIHRDSKDRKVVILAPRDSEFTGALKDIQPPPLPSENATPIAPSGDPTDAFLASLRDGIPKKD